MAQGAVEQEVAAAIADLDLERPGRCEQGGQARAVVAAAIFQRQGTEKRLVDAPFRQQVRARSLARVAADQALAGFPVGIGLAAVLLAQLFPGKSMRPWEKEVGL